jgi:phosphoribosylformylglycinamidine synthase PurS subunit
MKFKAEINIMPHKALLDPQGKAVSNSLKNIGLSDISEVRIGKHIHLDLEATSEEEALAKVDEACKKLLINPITEDYKFEVKAG